MVVIEAGAYLLIATLVWGLWRLVKWRRGEVDPVREVLVVALFLWSLVLVRLAFFPLNIVFYDWHATVNLIPFASITQLVRETSTVTANYNITGNVVLFVPLGFLLPVLFTGLRRLWPVTWRAAAISVVIEVAQLFTRARSSDIDDVILNTFGGALGFGIYAVMAAAAVRSASGAMLLERLGAPSPQEPLLGAVIPVGATAAIAFPIMLSTVFAGTLGNGPGGILGFATAEEPGSVVVARADISEHTFVVVSDGAAAAQRLGRFDFERVLPGRYTWVGTSEISAGSGSRYAWSITAFNPERNEIPTVVVWGVNRADAGSMIVQGNGVDETLHLPERPVFVTGFAFDVTANAGSQEILEDFVFTFLDSSGNDVTSQFSIEGR